MSFPLNPAQRAAVRYLAGPLLVLAGAGSGKTRVITAKIAHLVETGIDPAAIAAITFTNKAAREMRERAQELLACQGRPTPPKAATIVDVSRAGPSYRPRRSEGAGACARLFGVRSRATSSGSSPNSCATADRGKRTRRAMEDQRVEECAGRRRRRRCERADDDEIAAARAYANYGEALAAYQAVDFDDLIVAAGRVCSKRDVDAGRRWRGRCAHVLVDEYQDTNPAQYRLLRAAGGRRHAVHRGGRRRPGDLRLARRDARQPGRAAARLSESQGHQAGAELPVDRAHPALGQFADRATIRSCSRRSYGASLAPAIRYA